jgi:transcriptional regulator
MPGSDVYTGTLELLILRAVSAGAMHGYGIGRWIRENSGELLRIEEGALYPALHRLEKKKLLSARWGESELGRQAKFYRLTARGRNALAAESARWREYARAVESVLGVQEAK